jgi:hypothetical protein
MTAEDPKVGRNEPRLTRFPQLGHFQPPIRLDCNIILHNNLDDVIVQN